MTSMWTRRRNVASSHSSDGGMPSSLSFEKTASSTKFAAAGIADVSAPSGTVARKVETCP